MKVWWVELLLRFDVVICWQLYYTYCLFTLNVYWRLYEQYESWLASLKFVICSNIHNIILGDVYFFNYRNPYWKWTKQGSLSLFVHLGRSGVNANLLMPHISDITVNTVTLINAIFLRSLIFYFSGHSLLTLNDSYTSWQAEQGGYSYHVIVTVKACT